MVKILFCFLLISSACFSQLLSGTIVEENRPLLSETDFTFKGYAEGVAKYELAVDREGNVTSVRLVETTIKNTPTKYELRNHLKSLKFKKGNHYPHFHHVIIQFTTFKPSD